MTLNSEGATFGGEFERPAPPPPTSALRKGGRVLPILMALGAIAVFVGSVSYAYYQGTRVAGGEPPLIRADPRPAKLRPDEPGGLQVPNQDKFVFERMVTNQPDKRVERLLPPSETPMERPRAEPNGPSQEVTVSATKVVPPAMTEKPKPPPVRSTTLRMSAAAPKPAPTPATSEVKKPVRKTPVKPAPVASATGKFGLQLVSLRKPDGASKEWLRLRQAHGAVLSGLGSRVIRADLGAKGIYYRLVAGPFGDQAKARDACRQLKAKNQGCLVVGYN